MMHFIDQHSLAETLKQAELQAVSLCCEEPILVTLFEFIGVFKLVNSKCFGDSIDLSHLLRRTAANNKYNKSHRRRMEMSFRPS